VIRELEERLRLFLDLSWRSVMELRKSPDQFWGAVDAFAGGVVSWDQAASNGVLKEVRSWWLPWGLFFCRCHGDVMRMYFQYSWLLFGVGETVSGVGLVLVEKLAGRISSDDRYLDGLGSEVGVVVDILVRAAVGGGGDGKSVPKSARFVQFTLN
jgi:hypothetical protein